VFNLNFQKKGRCYTIILQNKSIPGNPLIATPMYLAGYIEKVGTGTRDIYRFCKEAGLKEPEFHFDGDFRITIWRKDKSEGLTRQVTGQVRRLLSSLGNEELSRKELQERVGLRSRENFEKLYLKPSIENGLIEMTIPDKPNSRLQKYRLTEKGKKIIGNK